MTRLQCEFFRSRLMARDLHPRQIRSSFDNKGAVNMLTVCVLNLTFSQTAFVGSLEGSCILFA